MTAEQAQQINGYKLVENFANLSVSLNELQTRVANIQQEVLRLGKIVNDIDRGAGARLQAIEEKLQAKATEETETTTSIGE